MRKFMVACSILGAMTFAFAGCGGDDDKKSDTVVIGDWGGFFTQANQKHFAAPFTKESGTKVKFVSAPGQYVAQVSQQAAADQFNWDMMIAATPADVAALEAKDLLEPLPSDVKEEMEKHSLPGQVTKYGVGQSSVSVVIVCNPRLVKRCPTTWKQFFDAKGYPGPRAVYNGPPTALAMAAVANGATKENLYPIDIDKGFDTLEKLKPAVKTWISSAEQLKQAFRSREVAMAAFTHGGVYQLLADMPYLKVSWDGAVYAASYNVVLRGAPHKDAAFDFLKSYAANAKGQADWAKTVYYGVSNKQAFKLMDPQVRAVMPETHLKTSVVEDAAWDAKHYNEVTRLWQQRINK